MIQIPNQLYFEEICRQIADGSRSVKIRVAGKSMEPFVRDGKDFVIISAIPEGHRFRRNELLLFRYNGQHIIHRVEKVSEQEITFKGDHQTNCEKVPLSEILAMVSAIELANGIRLHSLSLIWNLRSLCSRMVLKARMLKRKIRRQ
ncbi:MAG: S24/S26 family peptidase [Bacteroidales bacterium]|nr:S24/S26 family peptidase [Bacteroidales bacterium]